METTTQAVSESVALLASPAGWRRMTVAVADLRPGDVIVGGRGRAVADPAGRGFYSFREAGML